MRFVCESCRAQYMINDEKVGPKGVKVRCRKCGYVILVKRGGEAAAGGKSPVGSAGADPDDALATQVLQTPLQAPPPTAQQNAAKNMAADTMADLTSPGVPPSAAPAGKPSDSFLGDAGDDEIGAVFDQVLNSGAHSIPKEPLASEDRKTEAHVAVKGNVGIGEENDDRMSTRVLDAEVVRKLAEETGDKPAPTDKGQWDARTEKNGHHTEGEVPQTDWFVAIDEKQTGPLTLEKVKEHWDRGEISPDSLCWRAGFTDWVPVSEVAQLASTLAPRPASKPIVVNAPAGPSVVSVPVESAFSAGGMMKSVRSEVQVPISAKPEETGSWRPSTSLGSLVQDEMAALSRPAPKMADEADGAAEVSVKGLLDLPPPEDTNPSAKPINGKNGHAGASVEPVSRNSRPPPPAPPPANPYVATPGATFSSPGITQYRPEKDRGNLPIWIAIGVGAFLVVALLGTVIFLITRQPPPVVVQPVVQPPPVVVAQPPVAPPPPVVAVAPAPTAPAPAAEVAKTDTPPAAPSGPLPPGKTAAPLPPGKTGGTSISKTGSGGGERKVVAKAEPTPKEEKAPAEKPEPKKAAPKGDDDEFAREFGGGGDEKKATPAPTENKKKGGYVPPAPGSASSDVKESLGQADVFEVVSGNKPGLAKCVEEQRKKEPGVSGKLVMRWQILTSGKVSNVSVQSEEFKSTYIAGCMGGLIKTWTFPKHKVQGDPIVFPFKF